MMGCIRIVWPTMLSFSALVVVLPGCRREGPPRNEITGKITFRNQPLDDGIIEFLPLDDQGTKSGAHIQRDGTYAIPRDKGLSPGRYRVIIVGGDGASGGGVAEPGEARPGVTPGKERIPPEYNEKSNVIREVKEGRNVFDFDIP